VKENIMRNTILAAVAALAFVAANCGQAFAETPEQGPGPVSEQQRGNDYSAAADILANHAGHSASEVEYCQSNY